MSAADLLLGCGALARSANVTVTNIGGQGSASNLTTYTFTGQSIGTAAADRLVIVGVSTNGTTPAISSVTCGGVTMSRANCGGGTKSLDIFYLLVTTGTSATIVVNFASSAGQCWAEVWTATGWTSQTPYSVGYVNETVDFDTSITLASRKGAGGVAVWACVDAAQTTVIGGAMTASGQHDEGGWDNGEATMSLSASRTCTVTFLQSPTAVAGHAGAAVWI